VGIHRKYIDAAVSGDVIEEIIEATQFPATLKQKIVIPKTHHEFPQVFQVSRVGPNPDKPWVIYNPGYISSVAADFLGGDQTSFDRGDHSTILEHSLEFESMRHHYAKFGVNPFEDNFYFEVLSPWITERENEWMMKNYPDKRRTYPDDYIKAEKDRRIMDKPVSSNTRPISKRLNFVMPSMASLFKEPTVDRPRAFAPRYLQSYNLGKS